MPECAADQTAAELIGHYLEKTLDWGYIAHQAAEASPMKKPISKLNIIVGQISNPPELPSS